MPPIHPPSAQICSNEEARLQLSALIKGIGCIVKVMEFVNAPFVLQIQKSTTEAVPRSHWERVMSAANLTIEQLRDTLMLDILCSRMGAKVTIYIINYQYVYSIHLYQALPLKPLFDLYIHPTVPQGAQGAPDPNAAH